MMTASRSERSSAAARFASWRGDSAGVSAVEFALLSPLFCLILAAAIDLGGALYTQSGLNAAVSAGANYALVNAAAANSTSGASLAGSISALVTGSQSAHWANSSIVVNDGPTSSTVVSTTGSTTTPGGTSSNADSCYCPTHGSSGLSWGSATTCGSTCSDGNPSGKFISVSANRVYIPFFPIYNLIGNDTISSSMVVQVQ
jgi:Flp pilus assembly protein TadG